jgi:hypothetical protein
LTRAGSGRHGEQVVQTPLILTGNVNGCFHD